MPTTSTKPMTKKPRKTGICCGIEGRLLIVFLLLLFHADRDEILRSDGDRALYSGLHFFRGVAIVGSPRCVLPAEGGGLGLLPGIEESEHPGLAIHTGF